jgi:16S rRNA (uracil1498-N3)-methyltransferase
MFLGRRRTVGAGNHVVESKEEEEIDLAPKHLQLLETNRPSAPPGGGTALPSRPRRAADPSSVLPHDPMNLILLAEQAPRYTLPARDARFEHVRGVLRMRAGDRFIVGVPNGPRGEATLTALDRDRMEFSVAWEADPMPPPPDVHLVLALPRPATARKVLFEATTLGVRHFHFFAAEKGDPAYARSSLWAEEGWRPILWQAAEQAFSTFFPRVSVSEGLGTALAGVPEGGSRLALDVYEASAPLAAPPAPRPPLTLALGGERGWSARERERLRETGFSLRSLGPRVLRVETAVTVALAISLAGLPAPDGPEAVG